ncbi:YusW family protein [Lysinibacillus sp. NPDC093190]|uniref:YusW family protein n=1 Tax=Lysinibacillus sp. NPDC093190 TaxID=3390575 RepID=UPI003CFC9B9B
MAVDYSATESYEVEYENKKSGLEAKLKDERKNKSLKVMLYKIRTIVQATDITPNAEVIDQIILVFNIAEDFHSIEVEVEFAGSFNFARLSSSM